MRRLICSLLLALVGAPLLAQEQIILSPGQQYTLTILAAPDSGQSSAPSSTASAPLLLTGPIRAYGDSLTVGVGASSSRASYTARISAQTGCAIQNFGKSGAQAADLGAAVYQAVTAPGQAYIYATGVNDERSNGGDLGTLQTMARTQLAQLAWLAIPDALKIRGLSGLPIYQGATWSDTAVYGLGMRATAKGASVTYHVRGRTIYIALIQQEGDAGRADVIVDGVRRAEVSTQPAAPLHTINGATYAPQAIRIGNLPDGPHDVTISLTTNNAAWPVYVDWVAGLDGAVNGPVVLVGNTIPSATYNAGGSPLTVEATNAYEAETVRELAADGLRVRLVDLYSVVNPTTDLAADGYHPNDSGHAKIAAAFIAAMQDLECQPATR